MLRQNRETFPAPIHDHPDWHRGRQYYSVWLIELGYTEGLRIQETSFSFPDQALSVTAANHGFCVRLPFRHAASRR